GPSSLRDRALAALGCHPLSLDATGHLEDDLPCIRCGYDLRGLTADTSCPECGAPVAWSLRHAKPCFADPRWLNRVYWGLLLMVLGAACQLIPFCAGRAAGRLLLVRPEPCLCHCVAAGLSVLGIWLVTAPRHDDPTGGPWCWRCTGRLASGIYLGASLIAYIGWVSSGAGGLVVVGLEGFTIVTATVAVLMVLRRLLHAAGWRRLSSHLTACLLGWLVYWVLATGTLGAAYTLYFGWEVAYQFAEIPRLPSGFWTSHAAMTAIIGLHLWFIGVGLALWRAIGRAYRASCLWGGPLVTQ
ncbi:MAG: hypothetical protein ACOC9P_00065, partial [bacterium]